MNAWPTVRLDDCCDIVGGSTPSTSIPDYWGGDIPWATPKDLSELRGATISDTPRKLTKAGLRTTTSSLLPPGSVLFTSRAPIGLVALNTVPMATNQGFKSFVPRPGKVHAPFLYWWVRTHRAYLEGLGNGATFKELSKSAVSRVEIPLPPVHEQRRIAEVLNCADALRAKRREAIAHLDTLAQSIFLDMFGDPVINPQGLPEVVLGDVITSVSDGPHVSPTYVEAGVPFLSTRHVRAGEITWSDIKYLSRADAEVQWKKCKPRRDDILYTKGGTTGLAAIVRTDEPFAIWVHLALLRPDRTKVEPIWLESMLNSPFCYAQSQRFTHGIANRDLGLTRMVNIKMVLPPLDHQKTFVHRRRVLDALREKHKASLASLEVLFASLQHRAFRGEL